MCVEFQSVVPNVIRIQCLFGKIINTLNKACELIVKSQILYKVMRRLNLIIKSSYHFNQKLFS